MTDEIDDVRELDEGVVDLHANGETYILEPTLDAILGVSRHFGGFIEARRRVQNFDVDAMVAIVKIGAVDLSRADKREVETNIAMEGVARVMPYIFAYINSLALGGRVNDLESTPSEGDGEGEG